MTDTEVQAKQGDFELLDMIEASEPGNAERLALIGRGRIHYVDTLGIWVAYRDGKWELDGNGIGLQALAKLVPKSIFAMAETLTGEKDEDYRNAHIVFARKSNTEAGLKHMVTLARDLAGVRITHEDLDAKPWLFNCLNGTFDFMTNEFKPHDPGDLLTKQANVWYDPNATCPAWQGYLDEWQPDRAIQQFLAEITGSGLTGVAVQNLFVNVGSGRNGKGTFYKQIQLILGDYAGTAPEDMLVQSKFRVHDEEKARLRGCRFLVAPETGIGDKLDEAGIKNLTGGDMIHGRHLYGRPFDFRPTHTAFLHTNYRPQIRGTDPAIWSRVIEIPWLVTIQADKRDMLIDDKLEVERSGILNWLIAGCQGFKKHGIKPPMVIMIATEDYRQSEDAISRFVEDTFDAMVLDAASLGEVDYIPASTLRKHYEQWCNGEGVKPWAAQNVAKELRRLRWVGGQKRVGKMVIKTWEYPTLVTRDPSIDQASRDDSPTLYPVSTLSILKSSQGKEEVEGVIEINRELTDSALQPIHDLSDAEREADHREWLRDRGYPVPPTEEEIEQYLSTPWDEPEPDYEKPPDE